MADLPAPAKPRVGRAARARAFMAGFTAAKTSQPVSACPNLNSNDETDAAIRQSWLRGYATGSPG